MQWFAKIHHHTLFFFSLAVVSLSGLPASAPKAAEEGEGATAPPLPAPLLADHKEKKGSKRRREERKEKRGRKNGEKKKKEYWDWKVLWERPLRQFVVFSPLGKEKKKKERKKKGRDEKKNWKQTKKMATGLSDSDGGESDDERWPIAAGFDLFIYTLAYICVCVCVHTLSVVCNTLVNNLTLCNVWNCRGACSCCSLTLLLQSCGP